MKGRYNNYFDLLHSIMDDGYDVNVRKLLIREKLDVNLTLKDPTKCIFYAPYTKRTFNYVSKYLWGELSWYFNGSNNIENILKYSKFWNNVCDKDGKVNSNYGDHVFYKDISGNKNITNYNNCRGLLKEDLNSRRAIMLYNEPRLMFNNMNDYVCTQSHQFLYREDQLNSIVTIRSSDAIFGLTYDIPWWSLIQQSLAKELNMDLGWLSINIGSSHIYSNFFDYCGSLNENDETKGKIILKKNVPLNQSFQWYEDHLPEFISIT